MIRPAILLSLWVCLVLPGPAFAQTQNGAAQVESWRQVTKWKVTYGDATLGAVHGVAFCDWGSPQYRTGRFGPHCRVLLDNPHGGARVELTADGEDITMPHPGASGLRLRLHGASPEGRGVAPPDRPGLSLAATPGAAAKIRIKNDAVEIAIDLDTVAAAQADSDTVTLDLVPRADGTMMGRWSYLADPLTERGPQGHGRAGAFTTLRDGDTALLPAPARPGGFLALQSGYELWQPLSPRFWSVHVIEDQAGFDSGRVKFPRWGNGNRRIGVTSDDENRHLLIVGRDLPVLHGHDYGPIHDKQANGLSHTLLADYRASDLSPAHRQMIERGLATVTAGMSAADAASFRSGDIVLVEITNVTLIDAGPRTLVWGDAEANWMLQYGDNTAAVQFVRTIRQQDQPGQSANDEREVAPRLTLPERVQVEVRTGTIQHASTIPVVIGGPALVGRTVDLVATLVSDSMATGPAVFRTPPVVFSEFGIVPDDSGGSTVVWAKQNSAVFAKVDDSATNFLRATPATIMARPPQRTWLDALQRAATCDQTSFDETNWQLFARQVSQTIAVWGDSTNITYGDHAAMLLLRDAFVGAMQRRQAQLTPIAAEKVDPQQADQLIDGWYRSVEPLVEAWHLPLTEFKVASPAGQVTFNMAFDSGFAESTFHISTTADGENQFRAWRRTASHAALADDLAGIGGALTATVRDDCDREKLLALTGSGFQNIAAQISPLLMKYVGNDPTVLTEPDFEARAYVRTLDALAERIAAMKDYASQRNHFIVAVALTLTGPALELGWGLAAVGGEAVGALGGTVGGLASFFYDSGVQLYQTHKSHEDVAFAFAASAVLGLDRYFDAESRNSSWWATGAQIFGAAVMQGVGVYTAIEPLGEGLALWRGSRVAARALRGEVTSLEQLTEQERFDFALFTMREKQKFGASAALSQSRLGAANLFGAMSGELPAAEMAALAAELQQESAALDEAAGLERAASSDQAAITAAEEKTNLAGLAEQERATNAQDQATGEAATPPAAPATPETPPAAANAAETVTQTGHKPFPTDAGMPERPGNWAMALTTKDGQSLRITFEIKRYLNSGRTHHVYELAAPPTGLPGGLAKALEGKRLVLKLVKPTASFAEDPIYEILLPQTMTREKQAWGLLNQGDRQAVPHAPFQVFEEENFMLQEFLEFKKGKLELLPEELRTDPRRFAETMEPAKRVAILKLAKQIGDNNLEMPDFNYGNIYLENESGGWVGKILDPDYIVQFGAPRTAGNEEFMNYLIENEPMNSAYVNPEVRTALEAQMRHLERNTWLAFDRQSGIYSDGGYLKVSDLDGVLPNDWPYLPANARKPALLTHAEVSEGLARLRAVQAERLRRANQP